jgi:hypothetical protein
MVPPELGEPPELVFPPKLLFPPAALVPPELVSPPEPVVLPDAGEPPELVFPPKLLFPPAALVPPELVSPPEPVVPPDPEIPPESIAPPELVIPPELVAPPVAVVPPVGESVPPVAEMPPSTSAPPVMGASEIDGMSGSRSGVGPISVERLPSFVMARSRANTRSAETGPSALPPLPDCPAVPPLPSRTASNVLVVPPLLARSVVVVVSETNRDSKAASRVCDAVARNLLASKEHAAASVAVKQRNESGTSDGGRMRDHPLIGNDWLSTVRRCVFSAGRCHDEWVAIPRENVAQ